MRAKTWKAARVICGSCSILSKGSVELALAGYNAGEGAVMKYGYRRASVQRNPGVRYVESVRVIR